MKIAIVDDDRCMAEQIGDFVRRFREETGMEMAEEIFFDAVSFLADCGGRYDLVLMDVDMPGINGIEAARELRQRDRKVLLMFITNMAQYAIHGYEVEAMDYVLKPLSYPDFALKMRKALRYLRRDQDRKILLDTSGGKVPVKVSEIQYIEVIRHYLNFYTESGMYEVRGVMKEQEQLLKKDHFARCSQSYLVNLAHVKAIHGYTAVVGEKELPISRNRKADFVDVFTRYVGGME